MADASGKSKINLWYFLIALLPAVVFILNIVLLKYADPPNPLPERVAEFNDYGEAAARISSLGALMLFAGAAFAAVIYFIASLRIVQMRLKVGLFISCLLLATAALVISGPVRKRTAMDYAGTSLACLASGYDKQQSDTARAKEQQELELKAQKVRAHAAPDAQSGSQPIKLASGVEAARLKQQLQEHLGKDGSCTYPRFTAMVALQKWQFIATTLAFSALVFAGICCLAERPQGTETEPRGGAQRGAGRAFSGAAPKTSPPERGPLKAEETGDDSPPDQVLAADPELQHWEGQSEWLNTCLYLSALLLATSLLFINAFLRWPGFILTDHKEHEAYVAALVSYYGFTFTLMLAAFYIPIASILAAKVKERARATAGKSKLPDAFQGPLQILKIVLGLFSTALAGILPAVIDLVS